MTGVLVVDKPQGPTSHDVVGRVRRALGERRIGHTGTLDPLATGVLPLVVGSATRLASLLSGDDKEYLAEVRLGSSTDTYDATGRPLTTEPLRDVATVTREEVDALLVSFLGTYEQVPPAFSAKKVDGVASYKLARRQKAVALAPSNVTVSSIALEGFENGLVRIRLTCSAGFYVRSLAHELGKTIGCGGHLAALRRTRVGTFSEADAVRLETIEAEGVKAERRLVSGARLLPQLPSVVLSARGLDRASHGNWLSAPDLKVGPSPYPHITQGDSPFRLFDEDGRLVGIAERRPDGLLHPVIVLG